MISLYSLNSGMMNTYPSINPGNSPTMNSTTASGPLSTCRPCGRASVLTAGLIARAADITDALCEGLHMEAVNCDASRRSSEWRIWMV